MAHVFGQEAANYAAGRKGYDPAVFRCIKGVLSQEATLLDIGCGTGISTLEMHSRGFCNILRNPSIFFTYFFG